MLINQEQKELITMHIDAKPIDLKLTTPFRISRAVTQTAPNAIVQINHKDWTGYGEAAPDEFLQSGDVERTGDATPRSNEVAVVWHLNTSAAARKERSP